MREPSSSRWISALALVLAAGSGAFGQDLGIEGPSYAGANTYPSGTKPQSKLWFADGSWWGCLWSDPLQCYTIHQLDVPSQFWIDTEVRIDARPISRADCLWTESKLYVGSHRFNPAGGNAGHPLVVYRYAYDPILGAYSPDPGFPVQIADSSAETVVIDRDSTGTLWAVWMRDLRLYFAHTLGDDRTWTPATLHPFSTTDVDIDDIASVTHFGGNKIGVMWSDQVNFNYWFSVHVDGAPDSAWSTPEMILEGVGDDHVNLKVASDGRIFAVLKTSTDQIRMAVRETNGVWNDHVVSAGEDGWTRPICTLDEDAGLVHVFATSPILAGTIYEKVSPMDEIDFSNGIGTPVIRSGDVIGHNDATTTKQPLGRESGLVIVASYQPDEHYWYHHDDLGGPLPAAPIAAPAADPRAGYGPLTVRFIDGSSFAPTSWSWTFGDGQSSTQQHPVHTYANPGTYAVGLTVTNALGQDTKVLTDWITVAPPPTALTLPALEDTYLRLPTPDDNYGAIQSLRVRSGDYRTILKFLVPSSGNNVVSARLRLFVTDPSPNGGTVRVAAPQWQEPFVTWNGFPLSGGTILGSLGNVTLGTWAELDVSSAVTGSGVVAFEITSSSTNSAFYSSREGTNPPQLQLVLQPPGPAPVAAFTSSSPQGPIELTVEFTDQSTNLPTAWFWDFGDGATSTLQHPVHVYTQPGTYTVSLTAMNGSGSDDQTQVDYVHAMPQVPVASFTSSATSGYVPLTVEFSDTSSGPATSWSWDFGDGATSTQQNPVHVYTQPGTYSVSLTVTNESGSDVETLLDLVDVQPRRLQRRSEPPRGPIVRPPF